MSQPAYLDKVTALITRPTPQGADLLLFRHPTAGIQIPAGTVEEDEPVEAAVMREVAEETGLRQVSLARYLGYRDERPPGATHVILHTTRVFARPDPASFDWAMFRRGIAVRSLRQAGGFVQVTYEEGDRYPDPTYLTYQITGWVPAGCLASANRRHFFHLECTVPTPHQWEIFTDNHIFLPFWAPLDDLPEIIPAQRAWLDYILFDQGYRFGALT